MVEIIILIIVIVFIVNKRNQSLKEISKKGGTTAPINRPAQTAHSEVQKSKQASYKSANGTVTQTKVTTTNATKTGGSTTEYLKQKALMDELDHQKEDREEELRVNRAAGGIKAAERLYEGDSVPNGKRCVRCSYCAADNLVPANSWEKYSCYFCREPL